MEVVVRDVVGVGRDGGGVARDVVEVVHGGVDHGGVAHDEEGHDDGVDLEETLIFQIFNQPNDTV